jgi:arylsulfatase A-like enzyme
MLSKILPLCIYGLVFVMSALGAEAATRPNIVFVLLDDLDLRTASDAAIMPHVHQRLTVEGATFTRAYTEYALCSPSRATMLTGLYAHNSGVRRNATPFGGFETFHANRLHDRSVNKFLQAAGYRTALVGKFINGYPRTAPFNFVPPGWDYWAVSPNPLRFNYQINENGRLIRFGSAPTDYDTDVYTAKARGFIDAAADARQPFALYLWYGSIHAPVQGAPRHVNLFNTATVPRTPSFNEADVSDKPPFLRTASMTPAQIQSMDEAYRQRLRALQSVDEGVEAIYQLLRQRGLLGNTYLVFTSDNGFHLGEHRHRVTKGFAFEESIHVPLLVRGPGVPAGRRIDRLIGNADLAPTFARWGGLTAPVEFDGRSFASLLAAANPAGVPWRESLPLSKQPETKAPVTTPFPYIVDPALKAGYRCIDTSGRSFTQMQGVRTARYVLTHYFSGDMELYDTAADPFELNNRICSGPAAVRATLRTRAAQLAACRGATCRRIEDMAAP